MTKSKACFIFLEIYSDRFTDEEKMKAIRTVAEARSIKGITKAEMLSVVAYMSGIKQ